MTDRTAIPMAALLSEPHLSAWRPCIPAFLCCRRPCFHVPLTTFLSYCGSLIEKHLSLILKELTSCDKRLDREERLS